MERVEEFWKEINSDSFRGRLYHARNMLRVVIEKNEKNPHLRELGECVVVDFVPNDPCPECTKVVRVLKSFFSTVEMKDMLRIEGGIYHFTV